MESSSSVRCKKRCNRIAHRLAWYCGRRPEPGDSSVANTFEVRSGTNRCDDQLAGKLTHRRPQRTFSSPVHTTSDSTVALSAYWSAQCDRALMVKAYYPLV